MIIQIAIESNKKREDSEKCTIVVEAAAKAPAEPSKSAVAFTIPPSKSSSSVFVSAIVVVAKSAAVLGKARYY